MRGQTVRYDQGVAPRVYRGRVGRGTAWMGKKKKKKMKDS